MPAPAHPHHLHLTLANGLGVSLRHAPRLKRSAAALRVAAGSHDVPLAWPGLAHFLEHLLFLGTERFPTEEGLMAYVQRHGGQVNASTRERTTDFFFELPLATFAEKVYGNDACEFFKPHILDKNKYDPVPKIRTSEILILKVFLK